MSSALGRMMRRADPPRLFLSDLEEQEQGMLANPMNPLPTRPDDPRLDGWYHTIELAPGVKTQRAIYDHATIVHGVGMPESLAGKSALDIGTADGYWAFEMERRGA